MDYNEQLRDRRWQDRKVRILARDKNTCQNKNCAHREDTSVLMEVHHLDYIGDKMAWEYPDDLLITLCSKCHKSEQHRPKEEKYLLNTLRMKGFLVSDLLAHSCLIETNASFTENLLKVLRDFQSR